RHPLLEDIRVRQAIIAGIDREGIVEALYTDSYPLATGPLARTALGYTDQSQHYVHDPEEAARLLAEAGWEPGPDGILTKAGERLSVTFNVALPLPRPEDVLTMIQDQLGQLGIEVNIISGDQAAQNAAAFDLEQVQIYHQMVGRAEYDVIKSQWHSENRNVLLNGDGATGTVADPELDRLLDEVASQAEADDRAAASAAAQDHLSEHAYILPLFEEPVVYGVHGSVEGFGTESVGRPSFYSARLDG
ncbi:MAG: TIGR04028 family ABC transporter substrate-binding protein, partial [Propionibacterium sp.]|nr:TIGR04028 family ABC transporter substrate-binding protein [Propionibacterium sp.]